MAGCAFKLLFSPAVVNIRNENIHCSCPNVAQLCSNTPILDFGISDLLEVACLSFEDVLHVSECSHRGHVLFPKSMLYALDHVRWSQNMFHGHRVWSMVKDHVLWSTKHVLSDSLRIIQTAATEEGSESSGYWLWIWICTHLDGALEAWRLEARGLEARVMMWVNA